MLLVGGHLRPITGVNMFANIPLDDGWACKTRCKVDQATWERVKKSLQEIGHVRDLDEAGEQEAGKTSKRACVLETKGLSVSSFMDSGYIAWSLDGR